MIWWPHFKLIACSPGYTLLFCIYHLIPAYFADFILRLKGSKLKVANIYSKTYLQIGSYLYFMKKNVAFSNQKMQAVYSKMSEPDQIFFPTHQSSCDTSYQYVADVFYGLKKYILKETGQEVSNNLSRKVKVLKLVYNILWSTIYFFSACFLLSTFKSSFGNVSSVHHQLMD